MVAKRYRTVADGMNEHEMLRADVTLQMEAKRLAKQYNRVVPPGAKKVDFMHCYLVELKCGFFSRAHTYFVEAYVDGEYVKHSNNSGFVGATVEGSGEAHTIRLTPQTFSHFTWEMSSGHACVVDIQGVNDLYTDPAIHTIDGQGFG
eukprot:SAG31_NODE_13453_length_868_cov_1.210663_1_plen_146_part_10